MEDYITKIVKENVNLKIKNQILCSKLAVYDVIFDYLKMTLLWFHSFIMFFSDLNMTSQMPNSFIALHEKMFTLPEELLKIQETFINECEIKSLSTENYLAELNKILIYDKKNYRVSMNDAFKSISNINQFNNFDKLFTNFINLDKDDKVKIKNILKLKNDLDTESFIYNLKKIDILWNLVGTIFGKTPFLLQDMGSYTAELNNNFTLNHFTKFFETFFDQQITCLINNKHKFYIQKFAQPQIILKEENINMPFNVYEQIVKSKQNYLYSNVNFIEKNVNIAWHHFLERIFMYDIDKTRDFFENLSNNITFISENNTINFIMLNLHSSLEDLVRNSYLSVYKENFLLKTLLKFISVIAIYPNEFLHTNANYNINPILNIFDLLNKFCNKI